MTGDSCLAGHLEWKQSDSGAEVICIGCGMWVKISRCPNGFWWFLCCSFGYLILIPWPMPIEVWKANCTCDPPGLDPPGWRLRFMATLTMVCILRSSLPITCQESNVINSVNVQLIFQEHSIMIICVHCHASPAGAQSAIATVWDPLRFPSMDFTTMTFPHACRQKSVLDWMASLMLTLDLLATP